MIKDIITRLKTRWNNYKSEIAIEFYSNIADLITDDRVLQLENYVQHHGYTRLRHSLDVAFISFLITRALGWDSRSAARGGLLHDLYYYDDRDADYAKYAKRHAIDHPKLALENARKICTLNAVEENIIRRHMWLVTIVPPRYKEGFVVTFVDKYCAVREFTFSVFNSKRDPRSVFASV